MGYVTREMIDRAKKMDLLTYLQTYESRRSWCISAATLTAPVSMTALKSPMESGAGSHAGSAGKQRWIT